jgi:hypothetical protein
MGDDDRITSQPVESNPIDDLLRRVSEGLARDRKRLKTLTGSLQGRIVALARERVDAESTRALERLRSARPTQAKAPAAVAIRGARLGDPTPLPESLQRLLKFRAPPERGFRAPTGPAEGRELVELARVTDDNWRRAFRAIQHNARAIDALASTLSKLEATQREMARLIAELQSRGDVALLETLLSGMGDLDIGFGRCRQQIERDIRSTRRLLTDQVGAVERQVSELAGFARVQKLNDAATAMQTAAFGTQGDLLDGNNVLIAINHVVWGLLGDVAKALGVALGPSSPAALLSPLASLLVAQLTLGNRQHERFVSGVADGFVSTGQVAVATVLLKPYIAPSLWPTFQQRTDVLVSVMPLVVPGAQAFVTARVAGGVLTVTVDSSGEGSSPPFDPSTLRVGWIVDTQAPR